MQPLFLEKHLCRATDKGKKDTLQEFRAMTGAQQRWGGGERQPGKEREAAGGDGPSSSLPCFSAAKKFLSLGRPLSARSGEVPQRWAASPGLPGESRVSLARGEPGAVIGGTALISRFQKSNV